MRKFVNSYRGRWTLTILAALAWMVIIAISAGPADAADVCPEEGKIEATVDGELDDIILESGTVVCIKAQATVITVADGTSTLKELLNDLNNNGQLRSVSHYTVLETPPSTTTTTSTLPTTTTSVVEQTTTTVGVTTTQETTTTSEQETTTTTNQEETTTTEAASTTTNSPPQASTTTTPEASELPFTGPAEVTGLVVLALSLIGLGVAAVRNARHNTWE